ncbi:MAG TPA: DUF885 family protein, partial [Gemmatimonadales bacterium]
MRSLVIGALVAAGLSSCSSPESQSGEFAPFVNEYLDAWARRHPSIAAGNGIHQHDGGLDDFSVAAIEGEINVLKRDRDRLRAFAPERLTPDERVDQRILEGVIDGWLLEQETIQNWRRNPMLYASALSDGVHNLMTQGYAPAPERMRRVISKLAGVPALLQAARTNITNPPRIFAERGAAFMRGASGMLERDLALAFAPEAGTPLMDSLTLAAAAARPLINEYVAWLEREVIPTASGDFAIGGENVARRYAAEELIDLPLAEMLALGEHEMVLNQAEFRSAAEKLAPGRDPQAVWRGVRRDHPRRGEVVAAAQRVVDSLTAFVVARDLATVPPDEHVIVAPAQPFDLGFASMHASPPLEATPVKSFFYVTDARADQSREEQ